MADLIGEDWLESSLDMTGRSWVDMADFVELLKGMHFSRELDCGNWSWRWLERTSGLGILSLLMVDGRDLLLGVSSAD